jgi:hypothetical protein
VNFTIIQGFCVSHRHAEEKRKSKSKKCRKSFFVIMCEKVGKIENETFAIANKHFENIGITLKPNNKIAFIATAGSLDAPRRASHVLVLHDWIAFHTERKRRKIPTYVYPSKRALHITDEREKKHKHCLGTAGGFGLWP